MAEDNGKLDNIGNGIGWIISLSLILGGLCMVTWMVLQ